MYFCTHTHTNTHFSFNFISVYSLNVNGMQFDDVHYLWMECNVSPMVVGKSFSLNFLIFLYNWTTVERSVTYTHKNKYFLNVGVLSYAWMRNIIHSFLIHTKLLILKFLFSTDNLYLPFKKINKKQIMYK